MEMAEITGGALIAEQPTASAVEAKAAPASTQPLKATLSKIGHSITDNKTLALARAYHTATIIGDKAYFFGGSGPDGGLCSNDVHAFTLPGPDHQAEHSCYLSFPLKDATGGNYAPAPRTHHAACARGSQLIIHGGLDAKGSFVDDGLTLWLWDSEHLKWTKTTPDIELYMTLAPRSDHHIFVDERQDILVLHGGRTTSDATGPQSQETWLYDFKTNAWTTMPPSPAPALNAAYAGETLYTISGDSSVHYLRLRHNDEEREKRNALVWQTVKFPSDSLASSPQLRIGGVLVPVTAHLGRQYLIYMLGKKAEGSMSQTTGGENDTFPSDIWSLQLPATGFGPAAVKDTILEKFTEGGSGALTWTQVQVEPAAEAQPEEARHPGPRAFAGADSGLGGKALTLWGGINPKGEVESDGWMLQLR